MSHRAEQVLQAIQAKIVAFSGLAVDRNNVYIHRTLSLSENAGELDAITINMGDDDIESDTGAENFSFLDWRLNVSIAVYVKGDEESSVRQSLLVLRSQIHQALMADDSLGLNFVVAIRPMTALAPDLDSSADGIAGSQVNQYRVQYRTSFTNPES